MRKCSNCNAELTGRFCVVCRRDPDAPHGAKIDVPVKTGASSGPGQVVMARKAGYVSPVAAAPMHPIGSTPNNRFTEDAEFLLCSTGERIAWQGKPSILSLVPRAIGWGVVLLFAVAVLDVNRIGIVFALAFVAVLHVGAAYLNWRNTTYRITSQRIEYSRGVMSCTTAASPLSEIGNVTILRPFPWNMFGLGHLELDIPDKSTRVRGPERPLLLRCLQHLETTRDLIHSSSAILNQVWDRQRLGR